MKLDLLILQVAILFVPGLIWARLDARYGLTPKVSETEFLLSAFQFGLVSHGVTFCIFQFLGWTWPFHTADLSDAASKAVVGGDVMKEILWAAGVAFILSILWIYGATYSWLTRFLQFIGATHKFGDVDIWDYTLNSPSAVAEYVHFRDFQNSLVYAGWVETFSETEKLRELTLTDVRVYDFEGAMLYESPMIYIARNPDSIQLEFPYKPRRENS